MEEHKSLDIEIDNSLIKNLLNSELKRQLLSYIFLIHDEIFSNANISQEKDKYKEFLEIYELEKTDQSDQIVQLDRSLLENLWKFHLFDITKKDELDQYLESKSLKSFRNLFLFFKNENKDLVRYYFYPEELTYAIGSFFKEWKRRKILIKQQAYELENVRCRKFQVIHNILDVHNIDGEDLIHLPVETYEVLREMNLINEYLFFAEYSLHQILDGVDNEISKLKNTLVKIFPYYFENTRRFDGIVKKMLAENREKNIIQTIIDNKDDYDEDLLELISYDSFSQYHIDYILALDRILKLNWEFREIKEKAEKEYNRCFSDKSKMEYTDFVEKLDVNGPRNYRDKIDELLGEYNTIRALFHDLDLTEIEIAYHKFSIERLEPKDDNKANSQDNEEEKEE